MAKDALIKVDFGTATGTDKRIRISLAEGFKFIRYPVLTVQYSDREVLVDNELKIVLDSVTSKPQKQTYYPSYNSGYLEYKITPTTTQIEIKNLFFTVDENVYYGRTDLLQDAIKVEAVIDGNITNEMTMDIKQNATEAALIGFYHDRNIN
ncbi:MAG: hypothetical protein LBU27_04255 [Candidatus Peribacteria bacterium]|jgi:hypothetical protein|nr:hypothetical protein [Candidatus Peribacteria bacterium]